MDLRAVEPREGSVVMRFDLPAERLRMKGQVVRMTHFGGDFTDFRVTNVSDPDESGAVTLAIEAV